MSVAPTLLSLCEQAISHGIICGDQSPYKIFELPLDLVDYLFKRIPPLALQKLHEALHDFMNDDTSSGRKRRRLDQNCIRNWFEDLNITWKVLFETRWPDGGRHIEPTDCVTIKDRVAKSDLTVHNGNWHQMYWERHLQNCLDEAAEMALLPSFDGYIGQIAIPDAILESIGYKRGLGNGNGDFLKLSNHCEQYGCFARYLRLQNVLCVAEMCHLLRDSKLQSLVFRNIKSTKHVNGVCKLLNQNRETVSYLEFTHCWLPTSSLNKICGSLYTSGAQRHGIQHFLIKSSRILESNHASFPTGFLSFLSSGSSLCSLRFSYNHLGADFARMIFDALLYSSPCLSILELSECNISGFLSNVNERFTSHSTASLGVEKSLRSLHVLNLRGNHLMKDDVEELKSALFCMPNLQSLDISDNPIGDNGIRCLLSYFIHAIAKAAPLVDIKLENCDLSNIGVTELIKGLSTLREPLNTFSVADNELGSHIAGPLAKFLQTSRVRILNIEDIGLGSSGFAELEKELSESLELAYINISKNRGGIGAATFVSKLILQAPELVAVNACYNFMPAESLAVICAALKLSKGKLEQLDLTGNTKCCGPAAASLFAEFHFDGKPILILPSLPTSTITYDDDP